jgi:hypothetical protein
LGDKGKPITVPGMNWIRARLDFRAEIHALRLDV